MPVTVGTSIYFILSREIKNKKRKKRCHLHEPLAHPPFAIVGVEGQLGNGVPEGAGYLVERVERALHHRVGTRRKEKEKRKQHDRRRG